MNTKYTQDDAVESIDRLRNVFRVAILNKKIAKRSSSFDPNENVTASTASTASTAYTATTLGVEDMTEVSNVFLSEPPPEIKTKKKHYFTRKKKITYFLLILSVFVSSLIYIMGNFRF